MGEMVHQRKAVELCVVELQRLVDLIDYADDINLSTQKLRLRRIVLFLG